MELHELNIIYKNVPNFFDYSNGKIIELFVVHKNNNSAFFVNVSFADRNNKKKVGLFNLDIKNNKINSISKDEYLDYLDYIDQVTEKKIYSKLCEYVKACKKDKQIIEYNNHFIFIDNDEKISKYKSKSNITFEDNKKEFQNNICVLHSSPGLNTNYVQIKKNLIKKEDFLNIDYSTKVDLKIIIESKEYTDFGNIKSNSISNENISFLVELLEASLLSKTLLNELNFNKVSPGEIINVMLNTSKTAKVGKIDATNNIKRKFKYVTILNNYEINEDEIYIGDVIFSKKIKEVDISKIKPYSIKYTYVSIFIIADNISDAKEVAIKKINNIKNFIELLEKNSSIYQMYNKSSKLSNWNIDKLFIDYKLSDQFYIYNILDSSQCVYGSNKNITLKKYGLLANESEIIKYKNQLEHTIFNYGKKENKLFNAMFWLNRSLEAINNDISHAVIYLNIAIEYVTNGETCATLEEDFPDIKNTITKIRKLINDDITKPELKDMLNNKITNLINDSSVNKRFYSLVTRLNIKFTPKQEDNYKKIRDARNDIMHNNKEIDITQHNIIDCYIMISKVIFYKITEGIDEYI